MSSTTEWPTGAKFKPGDKVEVTGDDLDYGNAGTITGIRRTTDGYSYSVRIVRTEPEYGDYAEQNLQPDESGLLDLADLDQVIRELRAVAASTSEVTGLDSPNRMLRLNALARISFLASRAVWLEAADQEREQV